MQLDTKLQIAKGTLTVLAVVTGFFLMGVVVLVLCAGLQINPFKETTTSFLISAFVGLIGIAAVLVLLNVATNVSLIADAKIAELKVEPKPGQLKKWALGFFATAAILAVFIFLGTYLSKNRYLAVVRGQAEDVLRSNENLLNEIGHLLASGKYEDYKRIEEIRTFLQNQRSGLPELAIIYSGNFEGKTAIYKVGDYFGYSRSDQEYRPVYFTCTENLDCEYLTKFFSGEKVDVLQKYTMREDQFYIYIPVIEKDARFVLLFDRRNSYGKIGS